jgi:hypothetical protein
VIALGGMAIGVFAMGGLAIGLVPVGGCALGLFSVGGLGLGIIYSYSGAAVAPIAMGGLAVGYYSFGGAAFGAHPLGGNIRDPDAARFFHSHDLAWVHVVVWTLVVLSMLVSILTPLLNRLFAGKQFAGTQGRRTATEFRPGGVPPPVTPSFAGPAGATPPADARFSKLAICGALWISFFFLAFIGMYTARGFATTSTGEAPQPSVLQTMMAFTLLPLGALAPFGSTILGSIALVKIRRSKGRLVGLPLALADTLFFPLLALDVLLVFCWMLLMRNVFPETSSGDFGPWLDLLSRMIVYVLPVIFGIGLDIAIAFVSWRAVRKPVDLPAA